MFRGLAGILGITVLAALAGCVEAPGTIFKKYETPGSSKSSILTTDSRQRVVTSQKPGMLSRGGLIHPNRVVCTEPSPDVAIALANSLASGASFGTTQARGAASLATTQSEGLLQLAERTVAVQLIREQMYRTCEAYSNGAMTGTGYTLMMDNLNRTMVTFLLGEVAGGAVGRKTGALGGKASAAASASVGGLSGNIKQISEVAKELTAAENDLAEKQKAVNSAKEALATAEKKDPKSEQEVETKKAELKKAEQERDKAKGKRDELRRQLQGNIATAANASSEIAKVTAGGGLSIKPDAKVAAELREMQQQFLNRSSTSSYVAACVVELSLGDAEYKLRSGQNVASRRENQIFRIMTEQATRQGVSRGQAAYALNVANTVSRRSGLYQHCKENLGPAIALGHRDRFVRQREANSRLMIRYAKAVETCGRITDVDFRRQCLRGVDYIRRDAFKVKPSKPISLATAPARPIVRVAQADSLHTEAGLLKAAFEELKTAHGTLGKTPFAGSVATDDKRRKEAEAKRTKANENFSALETKKNKALGANDAEIAKVISSLTEARVDMNSATRANRRTRQAQLALASSVAQDKLKDLRGLRTEIGQLKSTIDALTKAIKVME